MTTIKLRRATAAKWAADNPVLALGEPGYETDTGKIKVGDGVTAWASLAPALSGTFAGLGASPAGLGEWFVDAMAGATDDAKFQAALTAWNGSAQGGTIRFGNRTYTMTSQWAIPNDGASPPKQKVLRITGAGAWRSGDSGAFDAAGGGTIIDHQFSGSPAKIDTRGHGLIEIDETICFIDSAGTTTPFFQTTLTTPIITCSFIGSQTGQSCNQDAVILGGGGDLINGTATAKFDGYGGKIDIWCDGIRECVRGNPACNAMPINVVAWVHCGSPDTSHAAIHLVGDATKSASANEITGLIEETNYPLPVIIGPYATANICRGIKFFDSNGTTLYHYYIDAHSTSNYILHDGNSDSTGTLSAAPFYEDPTSANSTTFVTSHSGQSSVMAGPWLFLGNATFAPTSSQGPTFLDVGGNAFYIKANGGTNTGFPVFALAVKPATTVSDGATTNGSNVVTSATAAFTTSEIGKMITGGSIPNQSRIIQTYTTSTAPGWAASTAYTVGQVIRPTAANGHMYQCTVAGTSGSSQPTFPTNGTTVTDGGVTWLDLGSVTAALTNQLQTATATAVSTTFGRLGTEQILIEFDRRHIHSQGSSPAAGVDAGAGTGATISVASGGTDTAFSVTLTTGTATASGDCFHVQAALTWSDNPKVVMVPTNAAAAALMAGGYYLTPGITTEVTVFFTNAPAISTAHTFDFIAIGAAS